MAKNWALHNDLTPSYIAGGAINAFAAVKFDTARNTVVAATAATDVIIWLASKAWAASWDPVAVKIWGYSFATVWSGWWAKGDKLTAGANGTLVATTTSTDNVIAIATEIAAATETAEVYLLPVATNYSALA